MVHPVLVQAFAYGVVMACFLAIFSFILRGFLWKYIKVRASQGRNVLVKVRTSLRDYYAVGRVEEGFLIYKQKKQDVRLALPKEKDIFYYSLGIRWVDVEEEKNAICCTDYSTVTGHDGKKEDDLLTRCLMDPHTGPDLIKIILIIVIVVALLLIFALVMLYKNGQAIQALNVALQALQQTGGTVVGSAGI